MSGHEAACSEISRFYRLCGHVEISHIHTHACIEGRKLKGRDDRHCWNELPLISKPRYVVGRCIECLETIAPGHVLATEPARNVKERGNELTHVREEEYSPDRIREIALEWRFKVEENERVSRVAELKKERELNARKEVRRLKWKNDWATYCARTVLGIGGDRAKILDLTDDFSRQRTTDDLLEPCQPDPDSECFCSELLSKRPLISSVENEAPNPVRFINGCRHMFHYKCIVTWLVARRREKRCPVCRAEYSFIIKNTYDDPKFRWVEQREEDMDENEGPRHENYQVSGHITFTDGLNGLSSVLFHPFLGEDRWGDNEGH